MTDRQSENALLRERLARAQFDAEGHTRRGGLPARWEDLPEGNREHRLADLDHMSVDYEWSDVDTFMFSILTRQAYEATHDGRPDYLLALDWVVEGWLPESHPKRQQITMIAEASAATVDAALAEQTDHFGSQDGDR